LTQFKDLGLAEPILKAVTAEGYTNPTPIQAGVIPAMLTGQDIVGIAQTGTGKTAAFTLPLLHEISKQKMGPAPKTCRALIMAPTRELAAQIADSIRAYGKYMRHSVTVVVGGVKPGPQIRALARGVDVVVATPGRLLDHVSRGVLRLDRTTTVILDEADQMLDLGFVPAIRQIMASTPDERQTLLLSATMPKQIRRLANDFLTRPVEVSVAPNSKPIDRIDQSVIFAEKVDKRKMLAPLLSEDDVECAIVFTRTKHGADKVTKDLIKSGLQASAIHGNKSQNQRQKTLDGFKSGNIKILVATDIAARGIDVSGVSHVINFELPNISESYVHRIGRTARAGKSGIAISFCDGEERAYLRDIEKLIGISIPRKKMDGALANYADKVAQNNLDKVVGALDDGPSQGNRNNSGGQGGGQNRSRRRSSTAKNKPAWGSKQSRNKRRGQKQGQSQPQGQTHSQGKSQSQGQSKGQSQGQAQGQAQGQSQGQGRSKANAGGRSLQTRPKTRSGV
jgi:ATP-dependent RNA helicase RhlE